MSAPTNEKAPPRDEPGTGQESRTCDGGRYPTDSAGRQGGSWKRRDGNRFDRDFLDQLRRHLPEYLSRIGVELKPQTGRLVGQCPVHDDRNPSFAVFNRERTLCGCWACDFSQGDVFALAIATGRAGSFPEAVRAVADALGLGVEHEHGAPRRRPSKPAPKPAKPKKPDPAPPDLSNPEFEDAHRAARRALFDACRGGTLRALAVARELGTNVETLQRLTYTSDALGIEGDRILYLYETGVKLRLPKGAKLRFMWTHGRAVRPWRWHFAARREVRTVFLCEGETDAIAAIASGLEELHPSPGKPASAVVASPGTSFPDSWGSLFRGKDVTLLFDADDAGRRAAEKVAGIIHPHARSVRIAAWKGGGHVA